jgi:Protein of unknown function (DUF2846)
MGDFQMRTSRPYSKIAGKTAQRAICLILASAALAASPVNAKKKADIVFQDPKPGQGQIVFFRNGSIVASALPCDVRENGKFVGNVANAMFFALAYDAGPHVFNPKSDPANSVTVDVVAGKVYYVKCAFSALHFTLSDAGKQQYDAKFEKMEPKNAEDYAKEIAKDARKKK